LVKIRRWLCKTTPLLPPQKQQPVLVHVSLNGNEQLLTHPLSSMGGDKARQVKSCLGRQHTNGWGQKCANMIVRHRSWVEQAALLLSV